MKKHIIIGLAVATLGYLCMQDALLVQDSTDTTTAPKKTTEEGDATFSGNEAFLKALVKNFSDRGLVTFRNASETKLTLTEEHKTRWDEIVEKSKNLQNQFVEKINKKNKKIEQMRDKRSTLFSKMRENLENFKQKQNKPLEAEKEAIQASISALIQQIEAIHETIEKNPKATVSELNTYKQKILDLEEQLLLLREKIDQLTYKGLLANFDFYKTYKYKEFLKDRIDIELKQSNIIGKNYKLGKEYYKENEALATKLYEIFKGQGPK